MKHKKKYSMNYFVQKGFINKALQIVLLSKKQIVTLLNQFLYHKRTNLAKDFIPY